MNPIDIVKCNCGALTVEINGDSYSMSAKSFDKVFPDLYSGDYNATYHSCDHCVNKWGTDLCGCGCGEQFGECENPIEGSDRPAQSIDEGVTGCYSESGW